MRLKSQIWVQAYLRACAGQDAAAMVVRHGDDDAGAIYIKIVPLDGTACLYGPAPAGLEGEDTDRRWSVHVKPGSTDAAVESYIDRQYNFDSDLWLIEVEDRRGRNFLDGWLAPGER